MRFLGTNLDWQTPQLYLDPEQYFPELQQLEMPIAEALVLPLLADNQPLGAIWIVSHHARQFDTKDLRIAIALADFAIAAPKVDRRDRTASALRASEERWQLVLATTTAFGIATCKPIALQ